MFPASTTSEQMFSFTYNTHTHLQCFLLLPLQGGVCEQNVNIEQLGTLKVVECVINVCLLKKKSVLEWNIYLPDLSTTWAGHIAHMNDSRWTIRSIECQIKGVRSDGRPKRRWRAMTLWGSREQHGQGQQKTEKVGGLRRRATSCSGRTQPKQKPRIEQNRSTIKETKQKRSLQCSMVVNVVCSGSVRRRNIRVLLLVLLFVYLVNPRRKAL